MHLILPVAGSSSRFPDMKPKWLLTHPRGHMEIVEAIKKLDLDKFESINLICLQEHEDKHSVRIAIETQFDEIANKAKVGCPISKLLNADISLDATLQN